jgi:hypothetical protein
MAGLAIGGFLEASTKPINQAGLILGLRYLPWLKDYVDLHIVTPYAGVRWVRNEAVTGAGAASSGQAPAHFGSGKPIFGISFDIAQALTWLK